ncbi:MAG: hypothetical protein ACREEV_05670 [Dongiaceae bacterium]
MVRMFAILSGFGLVAALVFGLLDSSKVQVTLFGMGPPTYDPSNFEDCGPAEWNGGEVANDDCYAYLRADADEPQECDYTLGFRAGTGAVPVTRLRVKLALIRDGEVIGRDDIQINSLERPADDPYVTKTIRGECDAKQVRIVEASANVDGQETDLIATESIASKGLMPLFPDFFVKIGPAAET